MIKIRISYDTQTELKKVLKHLEPIIARVKVKEGQNGGHKRAYIDTKND
mgnify:FL=1|jgi:hypothetical protein